MVKRIEESMEEIARFLYYAKEHELAKLNQRLSPLNLKIVKKVPLHLRIPKWEVEHRVLLIGQTIIREWRRIALNQFSILNAFEEVKWRGYLMYGDYPKWIRGQKMQDTLTRLNKFQKVIRFSYSGKEKYPEDEWVKWKFWAHK